MPNESSNERMVLYPLVVLVVVLLSLVGYGAYVRYPRFSLPDAFGLTLLILASAAGVASFFSPCSFPLLVTLIAHQPSNSGQSETPLGRGWVRAGALSAGAATFLLLMGAAIAFGFAPLLGEVTFTSVTGRLIRTFMGMLLIILGVFQSQGKTFSFTLLDEVLKPVWKVQMRLRKRGTFVGAFLYGFVYILAGLG